MRPIARTRHDNLERLVVEAGSQRTLALRAGTSESYLSQVRNRVQIPSGNRRTITDRLANLLETAMGKAPGWLDTPRGAAKAPLGRLFPLLSWAQAASWPADAEPSDEPPMIPCPERCSLDTFELRVCGHSMEPKFHEGELIFVDPHAAADAGRYVVVCTAESDEATFVQLVEAGGQRYLRTLDPDRSQPIVEAGETARICGVVVFHGEPV